MDSPRLTPHNAPWIDAPETRAVAAALRAGGREPRFVGGCVRDALAGRPAKDVDLATQEPPARVIELLQAAGINFAPTGLAHGTVTAIVDGRPFEVTTLRRDVATDGRRATVEFTDDWRADALRRDFTMNAMSAELDGGVHDYAGGAADLAAGCVRFVGDPATRIREDVLRILRFFRFHAHYGKGDPDGAGLEACAQLASLLPGLSGERVAAELLRLLAADAAAATLALMRERGVLAHGLPELGAIERLRALQAIAASEARDPVIRLAALLHDPVAASALADRLRLSGRDRDRLVAALRRHEGLWPASDDQARRRALYRLGAGTLRDLALLAWADGDVGLARPALELARGGEAPRLPVRGEDVRALGVAAGPEIGRLLAAVEAWWEAGDYRAGRDECLAQLKSRVEGA